MCSPALMRKNVRVLNIQAGCQCGRVFAEQQVSEGAFFFFNGSGFNMGNFGCYFGVALIGLLAIFLVSGSMQGFLPFNDFRGS